MALKIRGESEFAVSTNRAPEELLTIVTQLLGTFQAEHEDIVSADVSMSRPLGFQIEFVLSTSSYAQAEVVMAEFSSALTDALTDTSSMTTVAGRSTELVPA